MSDQPWEPGVAVDKIRAIARSESLTLTLTVHARERLKERSLIMSDILHVMKTGFVHLKPEETTREGYFKYAIESLCPNGGNRAVRVVVIPEKKGCFLKVVTVMWVDQPETRSGTIIGEYDE